MLVPPLAATRAVVDENAGDMVVIRFLVVVVVDDIGAAFALPIFRFGSDVHRWLFILWCVICELRVRSFVVVRCGRICF